MTCIVGMIDEKSGKVWIGGDSAGVSGYDLTRRRDTKVFKTKNEKFLIGFTSSFRMGQILRFSFFPPKYRPEEIDLYEYMCTVFVDELRDSMFKGGYATNENGEENGGCFLVGCYGRLFCIESDFQVGEAFAEFEAVGCGAPYAKGVMYACKEEPEDRIRMALGCATEFSAGVCGPFVIDSI